MGLLYHLCFPDASKTPDGSSQYATESDKPLVIAVVVEKGCGISVRDANKAANPVCAQGARLDRSLHRTGRYAPEIGELIGRAKIDDR
jgi:hypothetical protein